MKVIFTVAMDGEVRIRVAIPNPVEGEAAAPVSHRIQTKAAKVQMCKTNAFDEVLSTIKSFERAQKITRMRWIDAAYNFSNCLGQIRQTKLDELVLDYSVTEEGFRHIINSFIRALCCDENAKGTLKQSIRRGDWIKPKDVNIQDHNQKVQHLFKWLDKVPGFHN